MNFVSNNDGKTGFGETLLTFLNGFVTTVQDPDLLKRIKRGIGENLDFLKTELQKVLRGHFTLSRSGLAALGTTVAVLMFVAYKRFSQQPSAKSTTNSTSTSNSEMKIPKLQNLQLQEFKRSTGSLHSVSPRKEILPAASVPISATPLATEVKVITTPAAKQETRAEMIKRRALESTHIKNLYDMAVKTPIKNLKGEVVEQGEWNIVFMERTGNGFAAACVYWDRTVQLTNNLTDEQAIAYFAFELTNGILSKRHADLKEEASNGMQGMLGVKLIGREEFAKESERIEYKGTALFAQHMARAIEEMREKGWNNTMMLYPERDIGYQAFEDYYEDIKDGNHTEWWRKQWDRLDAERRKEEAAKRKD